MPQTMTPSGVEQLPLAVAPDAAIDVPQTMTPSGVEQAYDGSGIALRLLGAPDDDALGR